MGGPSKISPERWAMAKVEYELGVKSMKSIGIEFGRSTAAISDHAKRNGGWTQPAENHMKLKPSQLQPEPEPPVQAIKPDRIIRAALGIRQKDHLDLNEEMVLSLIMDGRSYQQIADQLTVSRTTILSWLDATEERAALVARARQASAFTASDDAVKGIGEAKDLFTLAKAREMAVHLRWKAKAYNPGVFGDNSRSSVAVTVKKDMTNEELDARIAALQAEVLNQVIDVPVRMIADGS